MRVRSILLAAFWVAMFIWVGYNGMQAVSSYFQTNDIAEQAFRDASDKQRQRNPGELFSSDFLADLRTGVLAGARRQDVQLDPATLKVSAEGGLVRVNLGLDLSHLAADHGRLRHRAAGADVARPELRSATRHAPPVLTRPEA